MLEGFTEYGYIGLFLASFLSSTILPFSSEIVFAGLISMDFNPWICAIIASVGNWLGGVTGYYLGKLGKLEWIKKYLKIKKEKIDKFRKWLQGKGAAMAFFSFLPFVGDVIPIALGYMRSNVYVLNISMFLGNFIRYIVIIYGMDLLLK